MPFCSSVISHPRLHQPNVLAACLTAPRSRDLVCNACEFQRVRRKLVEAEEEASLQRIQHLSSEIDIFDLKCIGLRPIGSPVAHPFIHNFHLSLSLSASSVLPFLPTLSASSFGALRLSDSTSRTSAALVGGRHGFEGLLLCPLRVLSRARECTDTSRNVQGHSNGRRWRRTAL